MTHLIEWDTRGGRNGAHKRLCVTGGHAELLHCHFDKSVKGGRRTMQIAVSRCQSALGGQRWGCIAPYIRPKFGEREWPANVNQPPTQSRTRQSLAARAQIQIVA
ncbi:hypothetical protein [Cupriavidus sp. H18C2]|uniref:hypothetical protein n=1 Tax=Cupriavidus sp. H18C2 TaxID=3241602 RepID=UPI003BF8C561